MLSFVRKSNKDTQLGLERGEKMEKKGSDRKNFIFILGLKGN